MRTAASPYGIDLSAPGGVEALLAFHRGVFGDVRMEEGEGDGAVTSPAKPDGVAFDGETFHFPEATPLAEMTDAQRIEYWRHKARKHESTVKARADYDDVRAKATKYDEHVASTASEVDRARAEARTEGERVATEKYQGRLVEQAFRIAGAGKVDPQTLSGYLADVDLSKFRGADGEPDEDRIQKSIDRLAPVSDGSPKGRWPAGAAAGGAQGERTKRAGTDAGRDLFASRRGVKRGA